MNATEFLPYLRAYSGGAIKIYLWLLARARDDVAEFRAAEIRADFQSRRFRVNERLRELALGHKERGRPSAPALIEILPSRHGCQATHKIRVLKIGG